MMEGSDTLDVDAAAAPAPMSTREQARELTNRWRAFTPPAMPFRTSGEVHAEEPVLTWWKGMRKLHAEVAAVALRYIIIPATSAPSERLFSTAGRVCGGNRARMATQRVEDIVRMHENSRRGNRPRTFMPKQAVLAPLPPPAEHAESDLSQSDAEPDFA